MDIERGLNSRQSTTNDGSPVKRKRNRRAKWAYLLEEDPNFNRWFKNLEKGSKYTARERARVLFRFLRRHDMTPQSLADFGKKDVEAIENLLMDFVSELTDEGKAPTYIESYIISVKSWLTWNRVILVRKIKVGNTNVAPTLEDERVPLSDELSEILAYASLRGKVSIALMAFSGVRPGVLGNLDGSDGLEIRDFKEMKISGETVVFTKIPTRFRVRHTLSKAKHRYMTFLTSEGCEYLKSYLEWRMANGEVLTPDSAIISIKPGHEKTGFRANVENPTRHIVTGTITGEIRAAMRPRFNWRPYVLRSYYDSSLLLSEQKGHINPSFRRFFMGHLGDIEAIYTVNKGVLPAPMIESMRMSIHDSEQYLSTKKTSGEDPNVIMLKALVAKGDLDIDNPAARAYLIKELNLEPANVKVAKVKEDGIESVEIALILAKLGLEMSDIQRRPKGVKVTKMVTEDELVEHFTDGWEMGMVLPSGKITIEKTVYR